MKILISLVISLFCLNSWAYVTKIESFSNEAGLSEKEAISLVHDTFIYKLWNESAGVSCGGDLKELKLVKSFDSELFISGVATRGSEDCLSVSDVEVEIVIEKINDGFVVKSSSVHDL